MKAFTLLSAVLSAALVSAQAVHVGTIDNTTVLPEDLNGSNFTYPWPVQLYRFSSQRQDLEMAFMDVAPKCKPNGKTAVLLHGKNFCGPTWEQTARVLAANGYRVILPDHVGFCKSSKPQAYQFSLQQFGFNINGLLQALGIKSATVIGHSLGGMTAARYALMFPDQVDELVMVDPIGLEDWKAKGVPYIDIDDTFKTESASTYASIRGYEQATYYVGQWKDSYDTWVNMLVNIYKGSQGAAYAYDQALVVDMVLTQPVIYEFGLIRPRALLITGDKDNTAIGAQWSPPDVRAKLGHYDVLGPEAAAQLKNGTGIHYPNLGHAPQLSDPELFHKDLLGWLSK
ncbi:uncharacterized protein E0L32_010207 [Thyridium curvatum]|uniref:AB hydrolase-1 domain-containing protein n=1 Tax=Thyridium curvatum TaxID=1093900 RepID=A0A507AV82_9PEZI|nr:uncharacterized protein E0L32_010207 [Thyridium curvatum]TPX08140.1 hypothetical protein E0L32_010207 [Thyridium curvatum]